MDKLKLTHRHLRIIDCLTARVFFISSVNGRSKKTQKRSLLCAALGAGTLTKLKQSIFAFDIYELTGQNLVRVLNTKCGHACLRHRDKPRVRTPAKIV